jgi:serine/threonine protein kinase
MSETPTPQAPPLSPRALLDIIRRNGLLSQARMEEAAKEEQQGRFADLRSLARWLMERDWVSAWQINRLQRGQVQELLLGPYVLMEPLSEDKTGQILKARHRVLNRVVALKIIRRELAARLDADAVRRFYAEVEVLARLDHPNVGHAFDAGPVGPTHFLAAEFVDGDNLEEVVKRQGQLPVAQAMDYVRQIALGLHCLREYGLAHHNLKPTNVVVTRGGGSADANTPPPTRGDTITADPSSHRFTWGMVKLFNFGLSSLEMRETGEASGPAGAVKDKVDYSAPEYAIDPQRCDIRADLYSLGCILYYLLLAREPSGRARREGADMLKQLRSDVPELVINVLRRLLAGRPEDRFQTPEELLEAMGVSMAPATPPPAPSAPPPAPPPPPPPPPVEKIVPTDWDDITTSAPVVNEAPPPPLPESSGLSLRTLLVVGGLMLLGAVVGLTLLLALLMNRSGDKPGEGGSGKVASAIAEELRQELTRRETTGSNWTPLRPVKMDSREGASLKALDDFSALVSGKLPDTDVYTVSVKTHQKNITGIRLEAMGDPSLPNQKMSRAGNGNFALTGIEVLASSADNPTEKPVPLSRAEADFVQQDFSIESVLRDGKPGWAVWDRCDIGQVRNAVFTFAEPLPAGPGTILTIRLKFESPHAKHIMGRFRISVSTAADPKIGE